jgi:TnpA family transposase
MSELTIEELYTDTAGFTNHVFALCYLVGVGFAPRIRDLKGKKLYTINDPQLYKALQP